MLRLFLLVGHARDHFQRTDNRSFRYYDADGNLLCVTTKSQCDATAARSYSYTSFDMAATIAQGSNVSTFGYTPEHSRGSLTNSGVTLYYFSDPANGLVSEMVAGASPTWRTYLAPYGHTVAEFFANGSTTSVDYFVGDHELSTTALASAAGGLVEYNSYDAWGKRRSPSGSDWAGCLLTHPSSATLRGYTSQEMLDGYCLVNLNARLYDQALARVISADPAVPDAMNGQAFNRYSYVVNNPVTLIDPTGNAYCDGEG